MKINWTVRFRNKNFWLTLIPAVIVLVSQVGALLGVELELAGVSEQLTSIVTAVFSLLAVLGIVNDPTTKGLSDSDQAMTYYEPKGDD